MSLIAGSGISSTRHSPKTTRLTGRKRRFGVRAVVETWRAGSGPLRRMDLVPMGRMYGTVGDVELDEEGEESDEEAEPVWVREIAGESWALKALV